MRHGRLRGKLGLETGHRKALMRNMSRNLVLHKRMETTLAKAKEVSAFMDRLIQIAKRGEDLHARRLLISKLGSSKIAHLLITKIAPHFKDRNGGYTRVLRLGNRVGDGAQKALLEFTVLVEEPKKKKPKKEKKPKDVSVETTTAAPKTEEKPGKKEKTKTKVKAADVKAEDKKDSSKQEETLEKKETEKKGNFLSKLRKFLKGDDAQ